MKAGVKVKNLCKTFGNFKAVDNLNIDIYEGQITALLGHNGAGKTTTMSIITGMIEATSGQVLINGQDIKTDMSDIQGILGFCPQHNMQFTDLTLIEHFIFFGMLKGLTYHTAKKESENLLSKFNLMTKKNDMATTLSGGMRRKLSLGMALIGNSKVLILDEPTSGLDVEARREIWDILQNERGSRTIIITTHFMEEADVLGDRIAIMDHGRLICYGTSMFLKKEYGAGYYLNLLPKDNATLDVDNITKIVTKYISNPNPRLSGRRLTYVLPHDTKKLFGKLLQDLDTKKDDLKIANINLSVSTLEEVFLKVGDLMSHSSGTGSKPLAFKGRKYTLNCNRISMQMKALFKKRYLLLKMNWNFYLIQLLIAFLLVVATVHLSSPHVSSSEDNPVFELLLSHYGDTIVYEGIPPKDNVPLKNIQKKYSQVVKSQDSRVIPVNSVSNAIIQKGIDNMAIYDRYMVVAVEFNQTSNGDSIIAMYSSKAAHGAPISINLLMNAAIKSLTGDNRYSITTKNQLLPQFDKALTGEDMNELKVGILWLVTFPLAMLFYTAIFVPYPQIENSTKAKHLQLMCNLRSFFYWCSTFLFDFILYLALFCLIMLTVLLFGIISTTPFSGSSELYALFWILLVYGLCVIPYSYLYSYKETTSSAFAAYIIFNLILSIFMTIVVSITQIMDGQTNPPTDSGEKLKGYFLYLPQFGLCITLLQFSRKVSENYNFNMNENQRESLCLTSTESPCCKDKNSAACQEYQSYLGIENNGVYTNLITMTVSIFIYFALLCLFDSIFVKKLIDKVSHLKAAILTLPRKLWKLLRLLISTSERNTSVSDRYTRSNNNVRNNDQGRLTVKNLTKIYGGQRVVNKINFKINGGTFYGLLGVNGAGKTTTFRLLAGDEAPSKGDAEITDLGHHYYISRNLVSYLDRLGYCPQFDAINPRLTGEQVMTLFAHLRGMNEKDIEGEVNDLINTLGFEEYKNAQCGNYSGGNKRKLSVGLTLIGRPMLIMLDEPTSGVDPVSRRKLQDVLLKVREVRNPPSMILTSHSMDECELLCDLISIMKKGKIVAEGTLPVLKQKYCQGFTVTIKLTTPLVVIQTTSDALKANPNIEIIKEAFQSKFQNTCELCDEHTTLLEYHITDMSKTLSNLFDIMEDFSKKFSFIEDYQVSETTLEEIFLSISKGES